ncbi:FAD-dependent thymidylate synthase [Candidatus Micrarchaeota archaeon]|nr:FAD-dependent thymidylate synthase [Candidatus Micrarchaeota archaeon]
MHKEGEKKHGKENAQEGGSTKRRVYSLNGYPEETVSVAFAKTSRSPEAFDEIISELDKESTRKFHETWVIKFGHGSVAEHASVHLAAENVSRLAVECIEGNRLGAYTEKSTRYQELDIAHTHFPTELEGTEYAELYEQAIGELFSAYDSCLAGLIEYYRKNTPKKEDEPEKRYEANLKLMALDNARFLLPNATLANVGITFNARVLIHAIRKMLSSPIDEVREIGREMEKAARDSLPTLAGDPQPSKYAENVRISFHSELWDQRAPFKSKVELVHYEKEALDKVVAAFLYRYSALSFEEARHRAQKMGVAEKRKTLEKALEGISREPPLREFEHAYYTFDLVMDQGAYCEFKRHRMLTLTPQEPTVHLGYLIPEDIKKAGLEETFRKALDASTEAFKKMEADFPYAAGYLATNAHYRRCLATMNLRELNHFIRLRSSPWAHFTIREVAKGMLEKIQNAHPILTFWIEAKS